MPTSRKRDNKYWAERLKKDGHRKLLERVENKELSMYKATQEAGYRAKQARSPADKLSFHWKRASYEERRQFVVGSYQALRPIINDVAADIRKLRETAKKTSQ